MIKNVSENTQLAATHMYASNLCGSARINKQVSGYAATGGLVMLCCFIVSIVL